MPRGDGPAKLVTTETPNFFILGAPKCGTTSLHSYLSQHPEAFLSTEKEPHFFDTDATFCLGIEHYVRTHFEGSHGYRVRGEATPAYLRRHQTTIARMKSTLDGDALRFVVLLRDPVQRAWSHYLHMVRRGLETESFSRALRLEDDRMQADPDSWRGYFRDGLYARQLEAWFSAFDRSQLMILRSEDLARDTAGVLARICRFLDVNPYFGFDTSHRLNAAAVPPSLRVTRMLGSSSRIKQAIASVLPSSARSAVLRAISRMNTPTDRPTRPPSRIERRLLGAYRHEIERLEKLLDWDLSSWKSGARLK